MGSGFSLDKEEEQKQTSSTQGFNNNQEVKPIHIIAPQVLQLPHNCEEILKHADSPIDKSSTKKLYDQLYAGVFLNQNKKKYWVDKGSNKNHFMLFARDLSITWAEDTRFWTWPLIKESNDESVAIAELINVCWLEIHGKFQTSNLTPGSLYQVIFVVKINDPAYGWETPVNFRLTLPDGSKQEHKEKLMEKPRGQWIEIPAGEFKASSDNIGEMEVSLYETEGGKWKRGLIVKGVLIRPKI